jgi:predicted transcriptional regulator
VPTKPEPKHASLSRRERQIMDVLHRLQRATAAAVRDEMPSPPSYSAVRALLAILERKGHVTHVYDGPRYIYEPVAPRAVEQRVALKHVVRTFFDGSIADAMVALLESTDQKLDKRQLDELSRRIAAARKEGR